MRTIIFIIIFFSTSVFSLQAQTLIYSGASDPEQINGEVVRGTINTDGDYVIATGDWASVSVSSGSEETDKAKQELPSTFDARWKYQQGTITDETARGFTIKYMNFKDEFRFMVDMMDPRGLVVFWANWGEAGYAGYGDWKQWGVGFYGANYTSEPVDVPDETVAFRVTFDGTKYEAYFGKGDEGWVKLSEMTLGKSTFTKWGAHSDPENKREFQIVTESGESRLDWFKIEGDGKFPNFNENVEESDNLFTSDEVISGEAEKQVFAYTGEADIIQINGEVLNGTINTSEETIIATGNWASVSVGSGTGEDSKLKMPLPSDFDVRWKYEAGSISDGNARGLTVKYNGIAEDIFRCMVDYTEEEGLVIFWAHSGETYFAGAGTWTQTGVGFGGADYTSEVMDIPDDVEAFRIVFDGVQYNVFYGQHDNGWVRIPELKLDHNDFPLFAEHSDADTHREFQINTESGESRLEWLKIISADVTAFNSDAKEADNLFTTEEIVTHANFTKELLLRIYPNPVNDFLHVETTGNIRKCELTNSAGQSLIKKVDLNNSKIRLNMSPFKSGFYILILTDEDNSKNTVTIIKN